MAFTALERILQTERLRQRAAQQGGFSIPALLERKADPSEGLFLASNMRGGFLVTRPSKDGVVRFGYSCVPVGTDDTLLKALVANLAITAETENWSNRCTSIQDGLAQLQAFGYRPYAITLSPSLLPSVLPDVSVEDAWSRMRADSQVAEIDETLILLADLPEGWACITAHPSLLGVYTRIGDYVGVLLSRANTSIVVVRP